MRGARLATAADSRHDANCAERRDRRKTSLVTYYVAMPFRCHEDGQIAADKRQECRDSFKARSIAEAMAADPNNCGAIAFSRTGDPAIGEFEDAMVIARLGEVDDAVM